MGGTASRFSDGRQAHIPLLLHPNPEQALFLGLGTGATFAASVDHPNLVADGVELVPEIIDVLPYFEKATGPIGDHSQLRIHVADARRYVNLGGRTYDVIVADLFHPARDGAGFLYTAEHFTAIRKLLTSSGIFCQWVPLYQVDLDVLRIIVRTFLHVFPDGIAMLATNSLQTPIIGLLAGGEPLGYPIHFFEQRVGRGDLFEKLKSYKLHRLYDLFGGFIAGPEDLRRFSRQAPLNTDDRPKVIFEALRFAYAQQKPAAERLLALVGEMRPSPTHILTLDETPSSRETGERLAAYWRALRAGVGVRKTRDVRQMLSQVREPLMSIVRESPDFEAAYYPLLSMARRLHVHDPDAALKLIIELESTNPIRQEAKWLRETLSSK